MEEWLGVAVLPASFNRAWFTRVTVTITSAWWVS